MAKDSRSIIGAVRVGGTVFTAGMEDEFAAQADAHMITRLTDAGVIEGFGKAKAEPEEDQPKGKGK